MRAARTKSRASLRCHAPRKRGIQYAETSRLNHNRLWNTGSPGHPRSSRGQAPGEDAGESGCLKFESEMHRILLLRRLSAVRGLRIDSAVWVPAFAGTTTARAISTLHSLRGLRCLAEHPRRRWEAAGGAVGDFHLILPRKTIRSGDHVLHERIGAIHRAALHRDI